MYTIVNYWELLSVLSNLFLLIAFVTTVRWRRIFISFLLFVECWVSLTYHVCMFSNACLLPYSTLEYFDFFFAQMFIVYLSIYFVHFNKYWAWLEWILVFIGCLVVALLQAFLPNDLAVQAGIVGICLLCVGIYWIIYYNTVGNGKLPPYDLSCLALGLCLISIGVMMFTLQNIVPEYYYLMHPLWHASSAMGINYIIQIKKPAEKYFNVASKAY